MNLPNAIVEFSNRSTESKESKIGDFRQFLGKDACEDSLADRNSNSAPDGAENVDALVQFNGATLRLAYRRNIKALEAVAMSFMGIAAWRATSGTCNRQPIPRDAIRG